MTARHYHTPDQTPAEMKRLRAAYLNPELTMASLVLRFRMGDDRITAIATRRGWPLRVPRVVTPKRRDEAGASA